MRFLIAFLILMFFCVGSVYYSNAAGKMPDVKWDGPYYAAALAKRVGNTLTGWAKARSTPAGRNGSYMCSMGMDVMPVSDSNIDGQFSEGVSHSKSIQDGTLISVRLSVVLRWKPVSSPLRPSSCNRPSNTQHRALFKRVSVQSGSDKNVFLSPCP